jgi:hypothetical protein
MSADILHLRIQPRGSDFPKKKSKKMLEFVEVLVFIIDGYTNADTHTNHYR